jgi:small subunit ribosomal protein S7
MAEVLAFNRWSTKEIVVKDEGLKSYITLEARHRSKTGARYGGKRFYKSKVFIVERLINKLMVPGHKGKKHVRSSSHITGKAGNARQIVLDALMNIERKTKENPIKVLVQAIENGAAREEIITIEYGGARYPKAVDSAPQRRIDVVLRYLVLGSYERAFKKKTKMADALTSEILAAYKMAPDSLCVKKKNEVERQADSSR